MPCAIAQIQRGEIGYDYFGKHINKVISIFRGNIVFVAKIIPNWEKAIF